MSNETYNKQQSQLNNKSCYKCQGIGLVINMNPLCNNCDNKYPFCYLCEAIPKSLYKECQVCFGTGKINNI